MARPGNSDMHRRSAGFTLFELLVVVAIIAIVLTAVGLAAPNIGLKQLELQGESLARYLALCRQTAILSGVPVGIEFGDLGYRALAYRGRWESLDGHGGLKPHRLPTGMTLRPKAAARAPAGQPDVVFLPGGDGDFAPITVASADFPDVIRVVNDIDGDIVVVGE